MSFGLGGRLAQEGRDVLAIPVGVSRSEFVLTKLAELRKLPAQIIRDGETAEWRVAPVSAVDPVPAIRVGTISGISAGRCHIQIRTSLGIGSMFVCVASRSHCDDVVKRSGIDHRIAFLIRIAGGRDQQRPLIIRVENSTLQCLVCVFASQTQVDDIGPMVSGPDYATGDHR